MQKYKNYFHKLLKTHFEVLLNSKIVILMLYSGRSGCGLGTRGENYRTRMNVLQ